MIQNYIIYLITLVSVILSDDIASVEVGADGKQQTLQNPNALEVIFENQSGRKVELYWDDNVNGVLQSELSHTSQITINTYIGHKFYFTPAHSNGSKANILYEIIMETHSGLVTLYNQRIMKERDQEFERKKNEFMREYFNKTGIRWKNYYPRDPITHFMYNFSNIGQEITAYSNHGQFAECDSNVINQISDNIMQQQREYEANKANEPGQKEESEEGNKKIPPFYRAETDDFQVIFYNDTYFCRNKNSENIEVTIKVLCTSPRVAYFDNFLSELECDHIKYVGEALGLKRSTVSEEALETEDRTSSTVWIERKHSPIIDEIVRRIGDAMHIDESILYLNQSSESLQLVHYFGGELYKAHVDYGTDRPHNRYLTFLMYLNNVNGGGFTSFPRAPQECRDSNGYLGVEPKQGRVAFFYDLLPDGNVDELTQHYAEPPTDDNEKWMTNLWIWDKVFTR